MIINYRTFSEPKARPRPPSLPADGWLILLRTFRGSQSTLWFCSCQLGGITNLGREHARAAGHDRQRDTFVRNPVEVSLGGLPKEGSQPHTLSLPTHTERKRFGRDRIDLVQCRPFRGSRYVDSAQLVPCPRYRQVGLPAMDGWPQPGGPWPGLGRFPRESPRRLTTGRYLGTSLAWHEVDARCRTRLDGSAASCT